MKINKSQNFWQKRIDKYILYGYILKGIMNPSEDDIELDQILLTKEEIVTTFSSPKIQNIIVETQRSFRKAYRAIKNRSIGNDEAQITVNIMWNYDELSASVREVVRLVEELLQIEKIPTVLNSTEKEAILEEAKNYLIICNEQLGCTFRTITLEDDLIKEEEKKYQELCWLIEDELRKVQKLKSDWMASRSIN